MGKRGVADVFQKSRCARAGYTKLNRERKFSRARESERESVNL